MTDDPSSPTAASVAGALSLPTDDFGALVAPASVLVAPDTPGPLDGLDFVVKDVFDVAGQPTGAGNPTWRAGAAPAVHSATAVGRLRQAGARGIGKARTDELAFSLSGVNASDGSPRNPLAPDHLPGGSSSGSAVAVASGMVPFALGTDTGGSIRVPASYCGLVGVRPTHGAIPSDGLVPLAPTFDTVAWLARDTATAAAVGAVLLPATSSPGPAPTRVVVPADLLVLVPTAVAAATMAAADRVAHAVGAVVEVIDLTADDLAGWLDTFRTVQTAEAHAIHGDWLAAHPGAVQPDVAERFAAGAAVSAVELETARRRIDDLRAATAPLLQRSVLVLPSAPGPAPTLAAWRRDPAAIRVVTLKLTCVGSLLGGPAVSLPFAEVDGLPLGISVLGAPGSDHRLLALAEAVMATEPSTTRGSER